MNKSTNSLHLSELLERDKTFSNLAARLALKGFALYPLISGYLIARHDHSFYAPDYRAVARYLDALEWIHGT
jgi:hypothetical protein